MASLIYAIEVLNTLPGLISAGKDVIDLIRQTSKNLTKMQEEDRDPTEAEWDMLNKLVEDLRAQRPDVSGE